MFQIAQEYQGEWSDDAPLKVEGSYTCEVEVTPIVARRRANGFLAGYVAMMVGAGEPSLVMEEQPYWRVPAVLRLPVQGEVCTFGTVDVDARTSEIIKPSAQQIQHMQELAHALAAHYTSPTEAAG